MPNNGQPFINAVKNTREKQKEKKNLITWGGIAGTAALAGIAASKALRPKSFERIRNVARRELGARKVLFMDAFKWDPVVQRFLRKLVQRAKTNKMKLVRKWKYTFPLDKPIKRVQSYPRLGGILAGGITLGTLALLKKLTEKKK